MKKLAKILMVAGCSLALSVSAQDRGGDKRGGDKGGRGGDKRGGRGGRGGMMGGMMGGMDMGDVKKRLEELRLELLGAYETSEQEQERLRKNVVGTAARADELQAEYNRVKVDAAAARERKDGLTHQIRTIDQSRENLVMRAQRLRIEAKELSQDRTKRIEEREKIALELAALTTELERRKGEADEVLQSLDKSRAAMAEREKAASEARKKTEELQARLSEFELNVREIEVRAETLRERFTERTGGDLVEAAQQGLPEGFDAEGSREQVEKLEEKIQRFGDLNLMADTEYEQAKERFEFLDGQRVDLEQSLDTLRQAIRRINRISRDRFSETFEAVNVKFKEVYPNLFRDGEAQLYLTDPENMLETGIDIVAQPPGKRPQHISLLSGGEKALTAVALIFSLFLVKPSPFCVLDEVDAPLDDANVERFSELLLEMAETSQFLVITHNKITMESADHLYGVTMEEPGVSELVSVRLASPVTRAEVA